MKNNKTLIITFSIILIFILGGFIIFRYTIPPTTVSLGEVEYGRLTKTTSVTGEIIPEKKFETLINPTMKVDNIHFKEGDTVRKGDVILSYDSEEIHSKLQKALLNLQYQSKVLSEGKSSSYNIPDNSSTNILSKDALDAFNPNISPKAQELQLDIAKEEVASLEKKLSSLKVTSPIDGKITKLNALLGAVPPQGSSIQVCDTSSLKVKIPLSQHDASLIKPKQRVSIKIAGLDPPLTGTVTYISPLAEQQNPTSTERLTTAEVSLDKLPSTIKIGYEAECDITIAEKKGNFIPFDSICKDKLGTYVFVVEDNHLEKKYIQTGLETDFVVEVVKGISKGDKFVKNPNDSLKEGTKVGISSQGENPYE